MDKYTLTSEEEASYIHDETRAAIRARLSGEYPEGVQVVNAADELLDNLGPSNGVELAVAISEEEAEERSKQREIEAREIAHYETEVYPKVIDKIRNDVRQEFRVTLRDKVNECLELRASLAKSERESLAATSQLRRQLETAEAALHSTSTDKSELLVKFKESEDSHLATLTELQNANFKIQSLQGELQKLASEKPSTGEREATASGGSPQ